MLFSQRGASAEQLLQLVNYFAVTEWSPRQVRYFVGTEINKVPAEPTTISFVLPFAIAIVLPFALSIVHQPLAIAIVHPLAIAMAIAIAISIVCHRQTISRDSNSQAICSSSKLTYNAWNMCKTQSYEPKWLRERNE